MDNAKPQWWIDAVTAKQQMLARQGKPVTSPTAAPVTTSSPTPSNSQVSPWQIFAGQPQGQAVQTQVNPTPNMQNNNGPILNQEAANAFVKGFGRVR